MKKMKDRKNRFYMVLSESESVYLTATRLCTTQFDDVIMSQHCVTYNASTVN